MSSRQYDPNRQYDDDETFEISGKVINSISRRILDLQQQVKDLKDAETTKELEMLRIRDKNPAVRDAWYQYQTMLGLVTKDTYNG